MRPGAAEAERPVSAARLPRGRRMAGSRRFWVGVATADHVAEARAGGFCAVSHGSRTVERFAEGDGVALYATRASMSSSEPVQRFMAIGEVGEGLGWSTERNGRVLRLRPAVWRESLSVEVRPLLPQLSFVADKEKWGMAFRRGRFEIPAQDFALIAEAMGLGAWAERIRREAAA